MNRAIGLYAHGVGVGAFVYLRRIFENLIRDAHVIASKDAAWNEQAYSDARMDDKILMLKHLLPDFLVQNRTIYGVMSLGLHELSEEECLRQFPAIRMGIELILDVRIRHEETAAKLKDAEKALQKIRSQRSP